MLLWHHIIYIHLWPFRGHLQNLKVACEHRTPCLNSRECISTCPPTMWQKFTNAKTTCSRHFSSLNESLYVLLHLNLPIVMHHGKVEWLWEFKSSKLNLADWICWYWSMHLTSEQPKSNISFSFPIPNSQFPTSLHKQKEMEKLTSRGHHQQASSHRPCPHK